MFREQSIARSSAPTAFIARRLFSIAGVVPIGAFLVIHLLTYARALGGRASLEEALDRRMNTPYLVLGEVGLLYLPLLYHAAYGIKIALEGRPNVGAYGHSRNWAYVLQRVTGVIALIYIAVHFWQFRLQMLLGRMVLDDLYPKLCASLSSTSTAGIPLVAIGTLLGIAACVFHLANGLWGFCVTWGITVSRSAQRIAGGVCGALGVLLFLVAAHTVIYFATGAALFDVGGRRAGTSMSCKDQSATSGVSEGRTEWARR